MESSVDAYINAQPEQAVDFNQFYKDNNMFGTSMDPNNILSKIANFFTGDIDSAKKQYETYLKNLDLKNEWLSIQSARAYEDSKIQRLMRDYEKAGLNPYLAITEGSFGSGASSNSAKASYSLGSSSKSDDGQKGRNLALILLALSKVVASLL